MRKRCIFAALLCAYAALTFGQDNRVFDWTRANIETIPMEPASFHAGRMYHPAAGGGNMHVPINIHAQTACEAEMLGNIGAREVFSGKAYDVLTEIARVYGLPIPHIYLFPGGPNVAYIAASTAVDGRGKIVVGQQAIELFDTVALKGYLGHEMAHLVSDRAEQGCNDYIIRDPQVEADADALAARTLGTGPVKAFLERVLALTQGQNWEVRQRLKVLP